MRFYSALTSIYQQNPALFYAIIPIALCLLILLMSLEKMSAARKKAVRHFFANSASPFYVLILIFIIDGAILTQGHGFITLSVCTAISLYIFRECVEWRRREQTKRNEIEALKKIAARECERNQKLSATIHKIYHYFEPYANKPKTCPYVAVIRKLDTGQFLFSVQKAKAAKKEFAGWLQTAPYTDSFTKYLLDTARLDTEFYQKFRLAYRAAIELGHLQSNIIDYKTYEESFGLGLAEMAKTALHQLQDIDARLEDLYRYCTGTALKTAIKPNIMLKI